MKNLLKVLALVLVLALAIGSLVACNDDPTPTPAPDNGGNGDGGGGGSGDGAEEEEDAALYDTLYVKDGLVGLYTAFAGDTTANLTEGTWKNRVKNSSYDDAALKGEWQRYDSGIGYRIVATATSTAANAREAVGAHGGGILLDTDYENLENFTVEVLATAYGVTDAEDNLLRVGNELPGMNNFRFGMLTSLGWISVNQGLYNRWAVSNIAWTGGVWTTEQAYEWTTGKTHIDDAGEWGLPGATAPTTALMTATKAANATSGDIAYAVAFNNTAAKVTFNVPKANYDTLKVYSGADYNVESDYRFSLFNSQAATVYAVRVYDDALTNEEKAQNRLADLLYFHGVALPEGFAEDQSAINLVATAEEVVAITLSENPTIKAANKATLEGVLASVFGS